MQLLAKYWIKAKEFLLAHPLGLILTLTFLIRIGYIMLDYPLWWDSHIYLGMGKYVFSGGKIGIWENFRPLVHPLMLGFFWKMGLNSIMIGKGLDLLFSLLSVYLVYKIGDKVYSKEVGLFASTLFSFTPIFIIFSGLVLTEPLTLFLGLWGIYFFFKDSHLIYNYFSGLFLGLAFLTKFPQGGLFLACLVVILIYRKGWKDKICSGALLTGGFFTLVLPYLILNYFLYHNPFLPFLTGSEIINTSVWAYGSGIWYYPLEFFGKNPLYLLFFPALYFFFKQKCWKDASTSLFLLITFLFFSYFSYLSRKEVRYMIFALPFLALIVGNLVAQTYQGINSSTKKVLKKRAFIFLFLLFLLLPLPTSLHIERMPTFEREINQVITEKGLKGTILTSDPAFVSFLDQPIVTLNGMEFAPKIYSEQKGKYQLLFINDCDLSCDPADNLCKMNREQLLQEISFENKVHLQTQFKNCTYYILLPKNS